MADRLYGEYLGRTFGKLNVIRNIEPTEGESNRGGLWLCECTCGGTIEVRGYSLHGRKSCGCLSRKAARRRGLSSRSYDTMTVNREYTQHRNAARRRGDTPLSREDWESIVYQPCHYCGGMDTRNRAEMPTYQKKYGATLTPEVVAKYAVEMNGVDRVDSSGKYEMGNVVPCCTRCNIMKNAFAVDDFLSHVAKIAKHNAL